MTLPELTVQQINKSIENIDCRFATFLSFVANF